VATIGNHAPVQRNAADELHVEVAHLEGAPRGFAHDRESLRQEVIDRRALLQAAAELVRLGAQRLIAQGLDLRLELVGGADVAAVAADEPLIAAAEETREKVQQLDSPEAKKVLPDKRLPRASSF
jgi:hypothetical protein